MRLVTLRVTEIHAVLVANRLVFDRCRQWIVILWPLEMLGGCLGYSFSHELLLDGNFIVILGQDVKPGAALHLLSVLSHFVHDEISDDICFCHSNFLLGGGLV